MAGRADQTVEGYMETIRRKTAVLIATSCRLGGLLSDASPEVVERLDDFGQALAWPSSSRTTSWTSSPPRRS